MGNWRGTESYIAVELSDGRKLSLEVEEFQPYEPSAYCWTPGYVCFSDDGVEYFVDECGTVWMQPANIEVGIAPTIKAQADAMEAALDAAYKEA